MRFFSLRALRTLTADGLTRPRIQGRVLRFRKVPGRGSLLRRFWVGLDSFRAALGLRFFGSAAPASVFRAPRVCIPGFSGSCPRTIGRVFPVPRNREAQRVGIPGAAAPRRVLRHLPSGPQPRGKGRLPGVSALKHCLGRPRAALNAGGSRRCFPRSAGPGDGAGRNFSPDGFRAGGCGVFGSRISNAPSGAGRSRRRISGRRPSPGLGSSSRPEPPGVLPTFGPSGSPLGRASPPPAEVSPPALESESSRLPGTGKAQRVGIPGAAAPLRVLRHSPSGPQPRGTGRPRASALRRFGRRQNVLRDRISGRRTPDSPRVGLRPLGHAFRVPPGLAPELSARPSRPTFGTAPRIRVGAQIGAHSRPAPPLTRAGPSSRAS